MRAAALLTIRLFSRHDKHVLKGSPAGSWTRLHFLQIRISFWLTGATRGEDGEDGGKVRVQEEGSDTAEDIAECMPEAPERVTVEGVTGSCTAFPH